MRRTMMCGEVRTLDVSRTVVLQGWVNRVRELPTTRFVVLRDKSGIVQITVDTQNANYALAGTLRSECVIEVEGTVAMREAGNQSEDYPTGKIEIIPSKMRVLSMAKPLPFPVDGTPVTASEETRMRHRYLDLRRDEMRQRLVLRHRVVAAIYEFLDVEGFISVETPMLTRSTPEGARDFLVPARNDPGAFYALPQSPQLFKQLLMIAGFDRYFQIARCFRDEDLRADRQPDFTQLDLEMSFVTDEDVIELNERLMKHVFQRALGVELTTPFPRLSYHDAMNRYGSDKPDLRFGLEMKDVGVLFNGGSFAVFAGAVAAGGVVKALVAPALLSRAQIETLEASAKQHGVAGLAWTKVTEDGFEGGIAKFLPESGEMLKQATGAKPGETLLFAAGPWSQAVKALGAVRLGLRELLRLNLEPRFHCSWVTEFPLLDRDDTGAWTYMHHPFTSPHPEDLKLFGSKEMGKMRALAYDLVLNGFEVAGGSIRIHDQVVQEQMFQAIGFDKEQAQARFGFFLQALEYGTPPHGGIAWGLDRVIAVMAGADSIRDVIAFPKNNRGIDPMTEAPTTVDALQLGELGIKIIEFQETGAEG